MNIIVAVDKNWSIGNQGQLLVNIPEDKRMFREETLGKVIIMGRKTWRVFRGNSHYMEEPILCSPEIPIIK